MIVTCLTLIQPGSESDRTKIITIKKKGVKDCREIVKTAIITICMVSIRPDTMHVCVWPTKITDHRRPCFIQ